MRPGTLEEGLRKRPVSYAVQLARMTPEERHAHREAQADARFSQRQVTHGPPEVDRSHLRGARWCTPWTYAESFNQPRGLQP